MAADFKEGDLYYVQSNGWYRVFKILKVETVAPPGSPPIVVHHIMAFCPVANLPLAEDVPALQIAVWHLPVDAGSAGAERTYLANMPVTEEELEGYLEYRKQMLSGTVKEAQAAFQRGNEKCESGDLEGAIAEFSHAAQLLPCFYEALDNRGLARLDLNQPDQAKQDFLSSIKIEDTDDNPLPHIKLIFCYEACGEHETATAKKQECLRRWPNHPSLQPKTGPPKKSRWKLW